MIKMTLFPSSFYLLIKRPTLCWLYEITSRKGFEFKEMFHVEHFEGFLKKTSPLKPVFILLDFPQVKTTLEGPYPRPQFLENFKKFLGMSKQEGITQAWGEGSVGSFTTLPFCFGEKTHLGWGLIPPGTGEPSWEKTYGRKGNLLGVSLFPFLWNAFLEKDSFLGVACSRSGYGYQWVFASGQLILSRFFSLPSHLLEKPGEPLQELLEDLIQSTKVYLQRNFDFRPIKTFLFFDFLKPENFLWESLEQPEDQKVHSMQEAASLMGIKYPVKTLEDLAAAFYMTQSPPPTLFPQKILQNRVRWILSCTFKPFCFALMGLFWIGIFYQGILSFCHWKKEQKIGSAIKNSEAVSLSPEEEINFKTMQPVLSEYQRLSLNPFETIEEIYQCLDLKVSLEKWSWSQDKEDPLLEFSFLPSDLSFSWKEWCREKGALLKPARLCLEKKGSKSSQKILLKIHGNPSLKKEDKEI